MATLQVVQLIGVLLAAGLLYIGLPLALLLLVLRHNRRKTVELWLETLRQGTLSPAVVNSPPPQRGLGAALAKAWASRKYPGT